MIWELDRILERVYGGLGRAIVLARDVSVNVGWRGANASGTILSLPCPDIFITATSSGLISIYRSRRSGASPIPSMVTYRNIGKRVQEAFKVGRHRGTAPLVRKRRKEGGGQDSDGTLAGPKTNDERTHQEICHGKMYLAAHP